MAFIDDIKRNYRNGSMLLRLIYINIAVFVVFRLFAVFAFLFNPSLLGVMKWIEVSSNAWEVLVKPWTVFTYSFTHYDIFHILFNMLWLYWLGRIFMEYFNGKQLTALYIYGGLGGAALYLLAYNLLPAFVHIHGYMLGASASIIAIVVATAVYVPDYKIGLLFIGAVSLKWVALVTVLIDLISIDSINAGGHFAHLGGALVGVIYGLMMRRGHDITAPFNAVIDWIVTLFSSRRGVGAPVGGKAYRSQQETTSRRQDGPSESDLDRVLAKIKRSGYAGLTDEERDLLFNFSSKNRK